ncbi:MFS transporter [Streptomyces sp. NPDC026672]|uniref:MFS transporter n=1 Tax=unclassified Streptomyces TaxID=2593676 RepID=UPI0033D62257
MQGIGAAALLPCCPAALLPATLVVITRAYPREDDRSKAIGIWAAVAGLALPLGPLVGGLLVTGVGWRWVFLVNLPITAAALVPVLALVPVPTRVPADRGQHTARPDRAGTVLGALTLTGCTLALIEGGRTGCASPAAVTTIVVTFLLGLAFSHVERRQAGPALPLELFRDRRFATANGVALVMNLVGLGTVFVFTLYLQGIQHRPPLAAGAALLPMFIPLVGLAPLTGHIAARYGPRRPATAGLLLGAAGTAWPTAVTPHSSYPGLLPVLQLTRPLDDPAASFSALGFPYLKFAKTNAKYHSLWYGEG